MKLFIVHVGFYELSIGIYELHSNILVVAKDVQEAKENVKNLDIFKDKQMHIDGIQEISSVDGYAIVLSKNESVDRQNKLYSYTEVQKIG